MIYSACGAPKYLNGSLYIENNPEEEKEGCLVFGPYWKLEPGEYSVAFGVEPTPDTDFSSSNPVCVLDVISRDEVLAREYLSPAMFGTCQRFTLEFHVPQVMRSVEFRVYACKKAAFKVLYKRILRCDKKDIVLDETRIEEIFSLLSLRDIKSNHLHNSFIRNGDAYASLSKPTSQLCTAAQFFDPFFEEFTKPFPEYYCFGRRQWEYAYIASVLKSRGYLREGGAGLGFGCGTEPLASYFAGQGASVVITDYESSDSDTAFTSLNLDDSYYERLCSYKTFREKVSFAVVDMNAIPESFVGKFDFTYSCSSLEHIGSLDNASRFIIDSMRCLKPGGIAAYTTEFNVLSNEYTLNDSDFALFRKRDLERLARELGKEGCILEPVLYDDGYLPQDVLIGKEIANANYYSIKTLAGRVVINAVGLIIKKL